MMKSVAAVCLGTMMLALQTQPGECNGARYVYASGACWEHVSLRGGGWLKVADFYCFPSQSSYSEEDLMSFQPGDLTSLKSMGAGSSGLEAPTSALVAVNASPILTSSPTIVPVVPVTTTVSSTDLRTSAILFGAQNSVAPDVSVNIEDVEIVGSAVPGTTEVLPTLTNAVPTLGLLSTTAPVPIITSTIASTQVVIPPVATTVPAIVPTVVPIVPTQITGASITASVSVSVPATIVATPQAGCLVPSLAACGVDSRVSQEHFLNNRVYYDLACIEGGAGCIEQTCCRYCDVVDAGFPACPKPAL